MCLLPDYERRCSPASIVFQDGETLAFLDYRPVFPGHCLLIPRQHLDSLADVPPELLAQLSANTRLLALAIERALGAQGAFIAINNRVSQSVPHVHTHVVPRTKGDGLKGFFWPRQKYRGPEHMEEVRKSLALAMKEFVSLADEYTLACIIFVTSHLRFPRSAIAKG